MERARRIHWGGVVLMLGTLVFLPVKIRHLVDPDDSLLGIFLWVGFTAWLVGLVALYSRYKVCRLKTGILSPAPPSSIIKPNFVAFHPHHCRPKIVSLSLRAVACATSQALGSPT